MSKKIRKNLKKTDAWDWKGSFHPSLGSYWAHFRIPVQFSNSEGFVSDPDTPLLSQPSSFGNDFETNSVCNPNHPGPCVHHIWYNMQTMVHTWRGLGCAESNGAQHIFSPANLYQNLISKSVHHFGTTAGVIIALKGWYTEKVCNLGLCPYK